MQDDIELLQEQIESLKLELCDRIEQQSELERELRLTHQELEVLNWEIQRLVNTDPLTLDEAKEIAKTLLVKNQPTREGLAQLLSLIYGEAVDPRELGAAERSISRPRVSSQTVYKAKQQAQLRAQYLELGTQFIALKAQFNRFRTKFLSGEFTHTDQQSLKKHLQQLQKHIHQMLD